ncbi:helix-turn-helix domain-containing protein [Nocardia implantans]|uniref:Helix-turn-helix domain-containing protein n=1 Tax=Nocardia implantans TaxID=3108168 RepID=A0ABU6B371_9NOCA|nr:MULTISPECIES: helix-turn-helix domain-containing protein [unclassified Nocardia]MBF6194760.1 helix-turn-helix transcriptional regulator [Nocardia beijingensis]MEA3530582.1 helix-turn-helix domain-containing protein [Nocardia sp. CDC192]MEB3514144.1 helix-turn-helix domain-containing protein [Nocardia sp. CDC186]
MPAVPEPVDPCPITPVIDLVFGRWSTQVLWVLTHDGTLRFTELQQRIPGLTPKVLTQRLRQLERDGLVARTYYPEVPPRVEYEATPLARTLTPVFGSIVAWSAEHLGEVLAARAAFDAGERVS